MNTTICYTDGEMGKTEFSEWLLELLNSRNMSMSEFSKRSGISQSQVSRVINGLFNPGTEFLNRTSKALNIPIEAAYQAAGIFPEEEQEPNNIYTQELNSIVGKLVRDADVKELIYLARLKLDNQEKEKGKK